MELAVEQYATKRRGLEDIALAAGDRIRIQKRVGGETSDVLDYTIPVEQAALVEVSVVISEVEAT